MVLHLILLHPRELARSRFTSCGSHFEKWSSICVMLASNLAKGVNVTLLRVGRVPALLFSAC